MILQYSLNIHVNKPLIRINDEAIATLTQLKVGAGLCSGESSTNVEVRLATNPSTSDESISMYVKYKVKKKQEQEEGSLKGQGQLYLK